MANDFKFPIFPTPSPEAAVHLPRYMEWLALRTNGMWSNGVPGWAKDHNGQMNDTVASRSVMEELAVFALSGQVPLLQGEGASNEPEDLMEERDRLHARLRDLDKKLSALQDPLAEPSLNLPPSVYAGECGASEKVWTETSFRQFTARVRAQKIHLGPDTDASGKPFVVRLAEDFAGACLRKGYVSTSDPTHEALMNEAKALTAASAIVQGLGS